MSRNGYRPWCRFGSWQCQSTFYETNCPLDELMTDETPVMVIEKTKPIPTSQNGSILRNELVSIRRSYPSMPSSENTNPNESAFRRPTWRHLLIPGWSRPRRLPGEVPAKPLIPFGKLPSGFGDRLLAAGTIAMKGARRPTCCKRWGRIDAASIASRGLTLHQVVTA